MDIGFKFVSALSLCLAWSVMGQTKKPEWAVLAQEVPKPILTATPTGTKPLTDILHINVSLPYRDPVGMQNFVDSVSDPNSPNYRHFLSPEQIGAQFGLSNEQVKQVSDYLTSQGMKVTLVSKGRISISAEATVAQAQAAFHVTIATYTVTLPGKTAPTDCFSITSPPSVPVSIFPFVKHIGGLDNVSRPRSLIRH